MFFEPASHAPYIAEAVDISAADHVFSFGSNHRCVSIYVGGAGDVEVYLEGAPTTAVVFKSVPAGTYLHGRFTTVVDNNTTATDMVGLAVEHF